jgi:serine/threonine protein kinase
MEHCEKGTLADVLQSEGGRLTEQPARAYFRDLVSALEYLHSWNIVHQGVRPSKILIAADGHAKLSDFSLLNGFEGAKPAQEISFLSPELMVHSGSALSPSFHAKSADVWAAGVTLHTMVFGVPLFTGSEEEVRAQMLHFKLRIPAGCSFPLQATLHGVSLLYLYQLLSVVAAQCWFVELAVAVIGF